MHLVDWKVWIPIKLSGSTLVPFQVLRLNEQNKLYFRYSRGLKKIENIKIFWISRLDFTFNRRVVEYYESKSMSICYLLYGMRLCIRLACYKPNCFLAPWVPCFPPIFSSTSLFYSNIPSKMCKSFTKINNLHMDNIYYF